MGAFSHKMKNYAVLAGTMPTLSKMARSLQAVDGKKLDTLNRLYIHRDVKCKALGPRSPA